MEKKIVKGRPMAGTLEIRLFAIDLLKEKSSRKVSKIIKDKFGIFIHWKTLCNWRNMDHDPKFVTEIVARQNLRNIIKEYRRVKEELKSMGHVYFLKNIVRVSLNGSL